MDNIYNKIKKVVPKSPKYKQVEQTTKRQKTCMVLGSMQEEAGSNRATLMALRTGKPPNSQQVLTGKQSRPILEQQLKLAGLPHSPISGKCKGSTVKRTKRLEQLSSFEFSKLTHQACLLRHGPEIRRNF